MTNHCHQFVQQTRATRPHQRQRAAIDTLPNGALRVRVYAGLDPLTKRRHDLVEIIAPGPDAAREAEKARATAEPGRRTAQPAH
jgi:hypothetical protein